MESNKVEVLRIQKLKRNPHMNLFRKKVCRQVCTLPRSLTFVYIILFNVDLSAIKTATIKTC